MELGSKAGKNSSAERSSKVDKRISSQVRIIVHGKLVVLIRENLITVVLFVPHPELKCQVGVLEPTEERGSNWLGTHVKECAEEWLVEAGPARLAATVNSVVPDDQPAEVEKEAADEFVDNDFEMHALHIASCHGGSRGLAVNAV